MEPPSWLAMFLLPLLSMLEVSLAKMSPEQCGDLGFSSNLLCNSCDELKQFKLDALIHDCNNCCEQGKEEEAATATYASATLKVCK